MSAIDNLSSARIRDHLNARRQQMTDAAADKYGAAAFDAPRDLAVAHETGHAICYTAENSSIAYCEVSHYFITDTLREELGHEPSRKEREDAKRLFGPDEKWSGFTRAPDDKEGTYKDSSVPDVLRRVRMSVAGIAGERVLYAGAVPATSSLDEIIVSQFLMEIVRDRLSVVETNSDLVMARTWTQQMTRCEATIRANEPAARELIAAFADKDRVEGDELQAILRGVGRVQ